MYQTYTLHGPGPCRGCLPPYPHTPWQYMYLCILSCSILCYDRLLYIILYYPTLFCFANPGSSPSTGCVQPPVRSDPWVIIMECRLITATFP